MKFGTCIMRESRVSVLDDGRCFLFLPFCVQKQRHGDGC